VTKDEELNALNEVIKALQSAERDVQLRILSAAAMYLGITALRKEERL
jgi:hypothetical protein